MIIDFLKKFDAEGEQSPSAVNESDNYPDWADSDFCDDLSGKELKHKILMLRDSWEVDCTSEEEILDWLHDTGVDDDHPWTFDDDEAIKIIEDIWFEELRNGLELKEGYELNEDFGDVIKKYLGDFFKAFGGTVAAAAILVGLASIAKDICASVQETGSDKAKEVAKKVAADIDGLNVDQIAKEDFGASDKMLNACYKIYDMLKELFTFLGAKAGIYLTKLAADLKAKVVAAAAKAKEEMAKQKQIKADNGKEVIDVEAKEVPAVEDKSEVKEAYDDDEEDFDEEPEPVDLDNDAVIYVLVYKNDEAAEPFDYISCREHDFDMIKEQMWGDDPELGFQRVDKDDYIDFIRKNFPDDDVELFNDRDVEFDERAFDDEINEYFDKSYRETVLYETLNGTLKKDGSIVLEGLLTAENGSKPITFTLTPSEHQDLNEEMANSDLSEKVAHSVYRVSNNLSEELFEYQK